MWITTSMRETAGGRGSEQEPPPPTGVVGSGSSSGGGEPGAPGVGRGVGWGAAPMGAIGMSGAGVAEGRVGSSSRIVWQAATPEAATTIARRAGVTVIRSSLDMADPKVTHGPAPVKARSVDHEAAAKPAVSAGLEQALRVCEGEELVVGVVLAAVLDDARLVVDEPGRAGASRVVGFSHQHAVAGVPLVVPFGPGGAVSPSVREADLEAVGGVRPHERGAVEDEAVRAVDVDRHVDLRQRPRGRVAARAGGLRGGRGRRPGSRGGRGAWAWEWGRRGLGGWDRRRRHAGNAEDGERDGQGRPGRVLGGLAGQLLRDRVAAEQDDPGNEGANRAFLHDDPLWL